MDKLEGQVAVVTGGGRGIGRAIALALAGEGAAVVVSSRSKAELDWTVAEAKGLGVDGLAVEADATDRAAARQPVEAALERFGRIDIVVPNVGGVAGMHTCLDGGDEGFEATLLLNLTSAWWTIQAAMPTMRAQRYGRIITIGSTEALRANEGGPPGYVAAKHGLVGLTRQLAQDCGSSGITANCICPGWTNTAMVDFASTARHMGITEAEARAYATDRAALGCIMEPEDIAAMALLLVSPEGGRITGQALSVDGGYRL
ncbi:SDR family oxidoreductase [Novosphingobium sp. G106]|uniref:SDR family NAD(P)-dependent oxidoreductase n=1 Tax=Novosphingobium sp. G106 TaxID=2849500 RepID=UPI001C2D416F|nr:SDR family oxidoreductase [Novosphingobium sp. G106]MBV1687473.1 SDR family oxidoreductase [Novosphingobium sp. G106]